MNVDEAIDDYLIPYFDNITDTSGGFGERRVRTLVYLQQTYDEVWHMREWQFKLAEDSGTVIAADDALAIPPDFEELGTAGGLFMRAASTDLWTEVHEVSIEELSSLINTRTSGGSIPECFALYGGELRFPAPTTALLYKLIYSKAPKSLVLDGDPDPDEFEVPVTYHQSVLIAGTIVRMQRSKGDLREDWQASYTRGLADMILRERPRKTVPQFLPEVVPPLC